MSCGNKIISNCFISILLVLAYHLIPCITIRLHCHLQIPRLCKSISLVQSIKSLLSIPSITLIQAIRCAHPSIFHLHAFYHNLSHPHRVDRVDHKTKKRHSSQSDRRRHFARLTSSTVGIETWLTLSWNIPEQQDIAAYATDQESWKLSLA